MHCNDDELQIDESVDMDSRDSPTENDDESTVKANVVNELATT